VNFFLLTFLTVIDVGIYRSRHCCLSLASFFFFFFFFFFF
jgi:hypothetical protein